MSNILIAYFSRAGQNYMAGNIESIPVGNTELVARMVAEQTGGDLFEIASARPYAEDYHECVAESRRELAENARPELAGTLGSIDAYDTIVLGYPNWCGTMPMPVYTFLGSYDFAGKKILPFCTNEGSGLSNTVREIAAECPGAAVARGLSITGHRAAEAAPQVERWLKAEL